MTTEEKAKAYDEAIERARKINSGEGVETPPDWTICEVIFPELKESEDERIRKELIKVFSNREKFLSDQSFGDITISEALTWLEKQDEKISVVDFKAEDWYVSKVDGKIYNAKFIEQSSHKKTIRREEIEKAAFSTSGIIEQEDWFIKGAEWADEHPCCNQLEKQGQVKENQILQHEGAHEDASCKENDNSLTREPKFKVGDWIVSNINKDIFLIKSVTNGYCTLEDTKGNKYSPCLPPTEDDYHLWIIEDAKPGDVLTSIGFHTNCTFIFKGLDTWNFDEPNGDRAVATGYCCLSASADKMEFGIQGPDCIEVNAVKPATKIQCDLLFKKMREAGYTFDFEKKELKEIEQNIGWSEEDKNKINRIYMLIGEAADEHAFSTSCRLIGDKECVELQDWLKSIRPQNTWKPSDEQIKAIRLARSFVVDDFDEHPTLSEILMELEEQLKELKAQKGE